MKGWVLRKTKGELKPEYYELNKLNDNCNEFGISLEFINPSQVDILVDKDDRKSILLDEHTTPIPDFVISRLGSATSYQALAVIRHLERLGCYSVNSSDSIENVKDKLYSLQILSENGISIPKTMLAKFPISKELIKEKIGFPLVIKAISGSLGEGVYLCENAKKFVDIMEFLKDANPKSPTLIVQEFIKESKGIDIRVVVVGGKIVGAMKRIAKKGEFKANFSRGGRVEPVVLDKEMEMIALESTRILNLDISGVDLLISKSGYKVCEVNSSPGFEGMEKAYPELNVANEIISFVKFKLSNNNQKI